MVTEAVVDEQAGAVYYLAFDLVLAEAPIRDGTVNAREARTACADPDDPATACRHAAIRAALLKRYPGFSAERDSEIKRARALAKRAGLAEAVIPDDAVRTVTLDRYSPTRLD
jgi:hypothetical protein